MKEEYEFSGAMGASMPVVVVGGAIVGVFCAFIYGYASVYNPLAGIISFILAIGYGIILGAVISTLGHTGKCRNMKFMGFAGFFLSLFSFYVSWAVFLYALIQRHGENTDDLTLFMFLNPLFLIDSMLSLNEAGWFSIKSYTPTGGVLWLFWVLEALIVVGAASLGSLNEDDVFCERCDQWCDSLAPVSFVTPLSEDGSAILGQDDLLDLQGLPKAEGDEPSRIRLKTNRCAQCGLTATYQFIHDYVTVDKDGRAEKHEDDLTPKYIIHQEDLEKLKRVLRPPQPS